MKKIKGLSLFANVGVAEAYLKDIGVDILIANELEKKRADFYKHIYPDTEMIQGDITNKDIYKEIIDKSKQKGINFIIATPPCQGMSTAGKMDPKDERNQLVYYAINAVLDLKPDYILIENVPQQLKTKIRHDDIEMLIPDYIKLRLNEEYDINNNIIEASEYGVPQIRQRSIFLMVRRELGIKWSFIKEEEKSKPITLRQAIGHLPTIDPKIQGYSREQQLKYFPKYEERAKNGQAVSKWHRPPMHKIRHIDIMKYTPEGMSALQNEVYYPKKADGQRIKGHANTYRRQLWDRPAYTVTTYNGAVCSYDNVHPGRKIGTDCNGDDIYSDARVLTIYELMIVMSLPKDWNMPENADESLIRHSIGEGIPPLVIKKLMLNLIEQIK